MSFETRQIVGHEALPRSCGHIELFPRYDFDPAREKRQRRFQGARCKTCQVVKNDADNAAHAAKVAAGLPGKKKIGGYKVSLRDYFAGQTLAGYLAREDRCPAIEIVANRCYEMADAMLAERQKPSLRSPLTSNEIISEAQP